jgi:uncharacterized protein (UPF0276 family)
MTTSSGLPPSPGAGFKPAHFSQIVAAAPAIGFFEVHAENYMGAGGPPHAQLTRLRQDYALSLHGVGLSLGSSEPLDRAHLARLRTLCDRYQPASFSEHLAWSCHGGAFLNDLLPMPYTEETLAHFVERVDEVQAALGRQILIENPATYLTFQQSVIPETQFFAEIARRAGCGLLLDINNVFVSAANNGFDAARYLADFPIEHVREIHLAGHAKTGEEEGAPLLIDAHDSPVAKAVWALFEKVVAKTGPVATLIEWDNNVPEWPVLLREAQAAQAILDRAARAVAA